MSRFAVAKAKVLEHLEGLAKELAPGGSVSGGTYTTRNPQRADKEVGSFIVWLKGSGAGSWKDYASDELKGDAIDFVGYCLGLPWGKGSDRRDTLEWIEDRYGLKSMDARKRDAIAAKAKEKKAEAERAADRHEAKRRSRAALMFHNAQAQLVGTAAEVYLAKRGIRIRELAGRSAGGLEASMRFARKLEWWMGRDEENGVLGPEFPAIVSAMKNAHGILHAVHCTFLKPDGGGKAEVDKPKLMFPRTQGLVIRVGLGRSNLDPEAAELAGVSGPCLLTEGLEDALTAVEAHEGPRVWAAGSLPGLLHVPDHACVSSWLVAKDRDWGKPQAQELFARAIARLKATGKSVTVLEPTSGKDLNDMARESA